MSDANRIRLTRIVEAVYGVTPATPTMEAFRLTGESLGPTNEVVQSQELRSDRQVTDLVQVSVGAGGDVNCELSPGAYDPEIAAALMNDADFGDTSPTVVSGVNLQAIASSNAIRRATGTWSTALVGKVIRVTGFSTAANNGLKVVTALATSDTDIIVAPTGQLVDEASGSGRTVIQLDQLDNGVTFRSYTIEREYLDLSNEFALYNGMAVDTWRLATNAKQIVTTAFGYIGSRETSGSATVASSVTAAPTADVLNSVSDVAVIAENGSASMDAESFTMNLSNNLRPRFKIGALGAFSVGSGTVSVTGTLTIFFSTKAAADRFLNNTRTSILVAYSRSNAGYAVYLPSVKFTGARRVAGGINTDIKLELQYQAIMHPTLLKTITVAKVS